MSIASDDAEYRARLERALEDLSAASRGVRAEATTTLRLLADPVAEPALVAALDDPDPDVRTGAAYALGVVGGAGAVPALVRAIADDDDEVQENALLSLQDIGPAAVPVLVAMARSERPRERECVFDALTLVTGVPDAGLPEVFLTGLGDPDARVRERAALALAVAGDSGEVTRYAVTRPALVRLLTGDPAPEVRARAAQALGYLGGSEAAAALAAAERDPDPAVVAAVADARQRLSGLIG
jgi:HEAT repeat protein